MTTTPPPQPPFRDTGESPLVRVMCEIRHRKRLHRDPWKAGKR